MWVSRTGVLKACLTNRNYFFPYKQSPHILLISCHSFQTNFESSITNASLSPEKIEEIKHFSQLIESVNNVNQLSIYQEAYNKSELFKNSHQVQKSLLIKNYELNQFEKVELLMKEIQNNPENSSISLINFLLYLNRLDLTKNIIFNEENSKNRKNYLFILNYIKKNDTKTNVKFLEELFSDLIKNKEEKLLKDFQILGNLLEYLADSKYILEFDVKIIEKMIFGGTIPLPEGPNYHHKQNDFIYPEIIYDQFGYYFSKRDDINNLLKLLEILKRNGVEISSKIYEYLIITQLNTKQLQDALSIFQKLIKNKIKPTEKTFSRLIRQLNFFGELKIAEKIYSMMISKEFNFCPNEKIYVSFINAFSKENQIEKAKFYFSQWKNYQGSREVHFLKCNPNFISDLPFAKEFFQFLKEKLKISVHEELYEKLLEISFRENDFQFANDIFLDFYNNLWIIQSQSQPQYSNELGTRIFTIFLRGFFKFDFNAKKVSEICHFFQENEISVPGNCFSFLFSSNLPPSFPEILQIFSVLNEFKIYQPETSYFYVLKHLIVFSTENIEVFWQYISDLGVLFHFQQYKTLFELIRENRVPAPPGFVDHLVSQLILAHQGEALYSFLTSSPGSFQSNSTSVFYFESSHFLQCLQFFVESDNLSLAKELIIFMNSLQIPVPPDLFSKAFHSQKISKILQHFHPLKSNPSDTSPPFHKKE